MESQAVGQVVALTGKASLEIDGSSTPLEVGSPVFKGGVLTTEAESHIEVRFVDDTMLSQGPHSEVSIDDYVYDQADTASAILLDLTEGTLRTITGKIADENPEGFEVTTPLATLGIRGTDFSVIHTPDSGTKVVLNQISENHILIVTDQFDNIRYLNDPGTFVTAKEDEPITTVEPLSEEEQREVLELTPFSTLPDDGFSEEAGPSDQAGEQEASDQEGDQTETEQQEPETTSELEIAEVEAGGAGPAEVQSALEALQTTIADAGVESAEVMHALEVLEAAIYEADGSTGSAEIIDALQTLESAVYEAASEEVTTAFQTLESSIYEAVAAAEQEALQEALAEEDSGEQLDLADINNLPATGAGGEPSEPDSELTGESLDIADINNLPATGAGGTTSEPTSTLPDDVFGTTLYDPFTTNLSTYDSSSTSDPFTTQSSLYQPSSSLYDPAAGTTTVYSSSPTTSSEPVSSSTNEQSSGTESTSETDSVLVSSTSDTGTTQPPQDTTQSTTSTTSTTSTDSGQTPTDTTTTEIIPLADEPAAPTDLILVAGDSGETLTGGTGNDRLYGGLGPDSFYGGAGDDRIVILGGFDPGVYSDTTDLQLTDGSPAYTPDNVIDGGTGYDTLESYGNANFTGVTINSIEAVTIHSDVIFRPDQFADITALLGEGEHYHKVTFTTNGQGPATVDLSGVDITNIDEIVIEEGVTAEVTTANLMDLGSEDPVTTVTGTGGVTSSSLEEYSDLVLNHQESFGSDIGFVAPVEISLSATSLDENTTHVGTLSVLDPDTGTPYMGHSYSILDGPDKDNFQIVDNGSGGYDLVMVSPVDYEIDDTSYSIDIQATSSDGLSYTEQFTITVNDVQDVVIPVATASEIPLGDLVDVYQLDTALLSNGNYLISWSGHEANSLTQSYAMIYDASGTPLPGLNEPLLIAEGSYGSFIEPLASGGFIASWRYNDSTTGKTSLYGRIYDDNGQVTHNDFTIIADTSGINYWWGNDQVTGLANGDFVLTYSYHDEAFGQPDIGYAQVFSPNTDGSVDSIAHFQLNGPGVEFNHVSQIGSYPLASGDDTFMVYWWDGINQSFMQGFSATDGQPLGNESDTYWGPIYREIVDWYSVLDSGHYFTVNQYHDDNGTTDYYDDDTWDVTYDIYGPGGNLIEEGVLFNDLPDWASYSHTELSESQFLLATWTQGQTSITNQVFEIDPAGGLIPGPPNYLYVDAQIGENVAGEVVAILSARDPDNHHLELTYSIKDEHPNYRIDGNLLILDSPIVNPSDPAAFNLTVVVTDPDLNTYEQIVTVQPREVLLSDGPVSEVSALGPYTIPPVTLTESLSSADYVVAWNDDSSVYMQIFDWGGNPTDVPISVTNTSQSLNSLTELGNGNIVISYDSDQSGANESYARIYDQGGQPVGGELMLTSVDRPSESSAVVTALAGGGFVAAWVSEADGGDTWIHYDIYDASGSSTQWTYTPGAFGNKQVAIAGLENGDFVITYDVDPLDGGDTMVYARVWDVDAEWWATDEIELSQYGYNYADRADIHWDSQVAGLSDGGFAVVWEHSYIYNDSGDTDERSFIATYDYQNNTYIYESSYSYYWGLGVDPVIDSYEDGFIVSGMYPWQYYYSDFTEVFAAHKIHTLVYDNDGNQVGYMVQPSQDGYVNSNWDPDSQSYDPYISITSFAPDVTVLEGDYFLVTYATLEDPTGSNPETTIYSQRYFLDNPFDAYSYVHPIGEEIQVNTHTDYEQSHPDITVLSNGNYVVSWRSRYEDPDGSGSVQGQVFSPDGSKVGGPFDLHTTTKWGQALPVVTALSDGGFVASWVDWEYGGARHWGQFFTNDGEKIGPEFSISNHVDSSENVTPAITSLTDGRFVMVWQYYNDDGSGAEIYGKVYGANGFDPGSEFLVNSTATGNQFFPAVTGLADGGFIVTWDSVDQDGSGRGVYGQRFSTDGNTLVTAIGSEFQINNEVIDDQMTSSVVQLANGNVVVTWHSMGQDGSWRGVYAKVYSLATDTPSVVTDEFLVNTYTLNSQREATVSPLVSGPFSGFVVTWSSWEQDGSDMGIFGQLFNEDGTAVGNEFQINTYTDDQQFDPQVVQLGDGSFVTVWRSEGQDGSGRGIFSQRFVLDQPWEEAPLDISLSADSIDENLSPNTEVATISNLDPDIADQGLGIYHITDSIGADFSISGDKLILTNPISYSGSSQTVSVTLQAEDSTGLLSAEKQFTFTINQEGPRAAGNEISLNTRTDNNQEGVELTTLTNGTIVASWVSYEQDGDLKGVFGQLFDQAGNKIGEEFQINSFTPDDQRNIDLAALPDGTFVATWDSRHQDGWGWGVYARIFNEDGGYQTPEFLVNSTQLAHQYRPSVTGLSDGGFVIVWQTENGTDQDIYAQRYDSSGNKFGVEFDVVTNAFPQYEATTTALDDGGFIISWVSQGQDGSGEGIYAQRYDAAGDPVGTEVQLSDETANNQRNPILQGLLGGGFIAAWSSEGQDGDSFGVFARIFDEYGDPLGGAPEFQVNTTVGSDQGVPAITELVDGTIIITWHSDGQDGSGTGVYGQAFDGSGNSIGSEFQLNTDYFNDQKGSAITALPDGSFFTAWKSDGQDGDGYGIYGKRFMMDNPGPDAPVDLLLSDNLVYEEMGPGQVIGSLFAPDADPNDLHTFEVVGSNGATFYIKNGNDLATDEELDFEDPPTDLDVTIRVTDKDGLSVEKTFSLNLTDVGTRPIGPEIQVSTTTTGSQHSPAIAELSWNSHVIVWAQDSGAIYGQLYDHRNNPMGSEFQISQGGDGIGEPAVAALLNNEFVVTWSDTVDGPGGIYARIYDQDGNARTDEFLVKSLNGGDESAPDVTGLDNGSFVISWQSEWMAGTPEGYYEIRGQVYNNDGTPQNGEFLLHTTSVAGENRVEPAIAYLHHESGFVASWKSYDETTGTSDIIFQRYNSDGTARGDEVVVATGADVSSHTIAYNDHYGEFVIVWDDGDNVSAQIFHGWTGEAKTDAFVVNSYLNDEQRFAGVAPLNKGAFIFAWESENQDGTTSSLYGRAFDKFGNPIGEEFKINTYETGSQLAVTLSSTWDNVVTVVWESPDQFSDGSDIIARHFIVDQPGNEGPSDAYLDNYSVQENLPAGALVGTLTATDQDIDDVHTFSVNGPNAEVFEIVGNQLLTTQTFDFEVNQGFELQIISKDNYGYTQNTWHWIEVINDPNDVVQPSGSVLSEPATVATPLIDTIDSVALYNGDYVVSWTEFDTTASTSKNLAVVYDQSGNTVSGPITISSVTSGEMFAFNAITTIYDTEGDKFLASWMDIGGDWKVYGRIYDSSGAILSTTDLLLSDNPQGAHWPIIQGLDNGTFVVATAFRGQDKAIAQIFNSDGTKVGGEFQINPDGVPLSGLDFITPGPDSHHEIGFLVQWYDGAGNWLMRAFDQQGNALGQEFDKDWVSPVFWSPLNNDERTNILLDSGHQAYLGSEYNDSSGNWDIFVDINTPDGSFGERTIVASRASDPQWKYEISEIGTNQFAVSWATGDGTVSTQYFQIDPDQGTTSGPPVALYLEAAITENQVGEVLGILSSRDGDHQQISYEIKDGHPNYRIDGNLLILDNPIVNPFDPAAFSLTVVATDSDQNSSEFEVTVQPREVLLSDGPSSPIDALSPYTLSPVTLTESLNSADYVVAWNEDSSVYMQIFEWGGNPTDVPISVTTSSQLLNSLTELTNGDIIVTYDSGQSGYNESYARVYDMGGQPVGDEFMLTSPTRANESSAVVAALTGGGFVAAWVSEADGGDYWIHYDIYDANGASTQPWEYTPSTLGYKQVDVAGLENGDFVITYDVAPQDGSDSKVYARVWDIDAGTWATGEIELSQWHDYTSLTESHWNSQVTGLSDGGFAVIWEHTYVNEFDGYTQSDSRVHTYDYQDGNFVEEADFRLHHLGNDVAIDSFEDGFVISGMHKVDYLDWNTQTDPYYSIGTKVYDNDGQPVGYLVHADQYGETSWNSVLQSEYISTTSFAPDVTVLDGDAFLVTYATRHDPTGSDPETTIYSQRYFIDSPFDSMVVPLNNAIAINQQDPNLTVASYGLPGSGTTLTNDYYVVVDSARNTSTDESQIYAQLFHETNGLVGNNVEIAGFETFITKLHPDVAAIDDGQGGGDFVVTWSEFGHSDSNYAQILGQRYTYDQNGISALDINPIVINNNSDNDPDFNRVTSLATGGFAVAINAVDAIYTRSFDGLGNPIGEELLVHTSGLKSAQLQSIESYAIAGYTSAYAITFWTDEGLKARLFDGEGNAIGQEFFIPDSAIGDDLGTDFRETLLSTNQLLEVDAETPGGGDMAITYRLLNPDWLSYHTDELDSGVLYQASTGEYVSYPRVFALDNNEFVSIWGSGSTQNQHDQLWAQHFAADPTAGTGEGPPTVLWMHGGSIAENQESGVVGVFMALDPNNSGSDFTYSIVDGNVNNYFEIVGNSLVLDPAFAPVGGFDYESGPYTGMNLTVEVDDGTFTSQRNFNVTVDNVVEPGERELITGFSPDMEYRVDHPPEYYSATGLTPATATLHNGDYVLVDVSTSSDTIRARIYNDNGEEVEALFTIHQSVGGTISAPAVTGIANDEFVVSWFETDSLGDTTGYFKIYSAVGSEKTTAIDFSNGTTPLGNLELMSAEHDLGFMLSWAADDGVNSGIFGGVYDTDGNLTTGQGGGTGFFATEGTPSSPSGAQFSSGTSSGDIVIVWQEDSGLDGDGSGIFLRYYDSSEDYWTETPYRVNETFGGDQINPTVAVNDMTGTFMVSWTGRADVYGNVFEWDDSSSEILPNSPEIKITDWYEPLHNQGIVSGDDMYMVYWISYYNSDYGIRGQLFDSDGLPVTDKFNLNPLVSEVNNASVTLLHTEGDNAVAIAWEGMTRDHSTGEPNVFKANLSLLTKTEGDDTSETISHEDLDMFSMIFGRGGDDTITGGSYADLIKGGEGADKMYGGGGDDTFLIWGEFLTTDYTYDDPDTLFDETNDLFGDSLLAGNSVSHFVPGEIIDGGLGHNTIESYGTVNFSENNTTITNIQEFNPHSNVTFSIGQLEEFGVTTISGNGEEAHILNFVGEGELDLTGIEITNIDEINIESGIELILTAEQEAILPINVVESLDTDAQLAEYSSEETGTVEPVFGDDASLTSETESVAAIDSESTNEEPIFGDETDLSGQVEDEVALADSTSQQNGEEPIFGDSTTSEPLVDSVEAVEPLLADSGEDTAMDLVDGDTALEEDVQLDSGADADAIWLASQVEDVDSVV